MVSRYGALWTTTHGDAPSQIDQGEWGEMLSSLSEDEIRKGFIEDLRRGSDFPPSSAKFAAMCRPPASPQSQLPMYQPFVSDRAHRLESSDSRACAKRHLDDIAARLGVDLGDLA
ncbi:MAG TPA: hypothetical protein VFK31_09600 [Rhodanobacteraceae bacterium]|nr:hypothetical protein [Rhodanobacteraceae bacterium]